MMEKFIERVNVLIYGFGKELEEDKEKLKELGGSAWIRDQIRKAYTESKASEE